MPTTEEPVRNPTWMADIRFFFTPEDVDHMGRLSIPLDTYAAVKANAIRVLGATEPPDASMPPDPRDKWSQAKWDTFKRWIINGYPFGTAVPQAFALFEAAVAAKRVRKDAGTLGTGEIRQLRTAFEGLMALPPDDPRGYFAQAGVHWLPGRLPGPTFFCLHHENRYNPWHRQYLVNFEDALRSVPGCADVTLPYWDITSPVPAFLYEPPFDKYVLPRGIGRGFDAGYVTRRYTPARIAENVASFGIPRQIADALSKTVWSQFNKVIISAHDNGHVATGETMAMQDVAAFDPIFWFFHCNLDRLWWKWQQGVGATTLSGFLSTVTGSTDWLKTSPFNSLPPFPQTAAQTIDLSVYDIGYQHPAVEGLPAPLPEAAGSLPAAELTGVRAAGTASVRVKGIDRLNIPGTFVVHLKADGVTVGRQAFFQALNPRTCTACLKQGRVDIDLEVGVDQLRGVPLEVVIEPTWPDALGRRFPLSSAGDPTVNIRLLLE